MSDSDERDSLLAAGGTTRQLVQQDIMAGIRTPEDSDNEDEERQKTKLGLSIVYLLAMSVCGLILVSLGATLTYLANRVGKTTTEIGTVFLARGVGAVSGAIVSSKLYKLYKGNNIMIPNLLILCACLIGLLFNESVVILHILFFALGICTAIVDTGVQIQCRKLHGRQAGPWLGANTVAFGCAGLIVPLIELVVSSEMLEFIILAFIILAVAVSMWFVPHVEDYISTRKVPIGGPVPRPKGPHYNVEIVIAFMVFCYVGSKVSLTSYLYTFIEDTITLDNSQESLALLVLWIFITIGRLMGVYDQRFVNNRTLPVHLFTLSGGATLAMMMIVVLPHSAVALWMGLSFFGLFNGPCVGYCYDMNNRLTSPSEESMSIVMLGLNMGASVVPWLSSLLMSAFDNPYVLIWIILFANALPMIPVFFLKSMSYDPAVNPYLRVGGSDDEEEGGEREEGGHT
jgi:predicted MFS family arabinose efflux permease